MINIENIDPAILNYTTDRGDETQRNFRYQHAFGAILLIAGASKKKPYSCIWCEHHEDILAQKEDGNFDAFQVKTKRPELGSWETLDEEVVKSIKRFVNLYQKFNDCITFHFVSNTDFFTCGDIVKDAKTLKKSPERFIEGVKTSIDFNSIPVPFDSIFNKLCISCDCNASDLFETIKKINFIKGPSRDSFDTEITASHLIQIEDCKSFNVSALNEIRDELIHSVYDASSLKVEDPYKHLYSNSDSKINPTVLAKRISIEKVSSCIESYKQIIFRYKPHNITLKIDELGNNNFDILTEKFVEGNLLEQLPTMKRRTLNAESRLLELGFINSSEINEILTQLESVVQAECDEALLEAKVENNNMEDSSLGFLAFIKKEKPFGSNMLQKVHVRLKNIASNESKKVFNESYEVLIGIAGLLTENCSIWWSKKFKLKSSK